MTNLNNLADTIIERLADPLWVVPTCWQPIATAPKDGTDLLVCWPIYPGQTNMAVVYWVGANGMGHFYRGTEVIWGATHWMPLPLCPEDAEKGPRPCVTARQEESFLARPKSEAGGYPAHVKRVSTDTEGRRVTQFAVVCDSHGIDNDDLVERIAEFLNTESRDRDGEAASGRRLAWLLHQVELLQREIEQLQKERA